MFDVVLGTPDGLSALDMPIYGGSLWVCNMASRTESGSPLETATETIDEQILEAFEILGNEIRLAVLLALWEARDPSPESRYDTSLSYTEIRDRIGRLDSGNFNYHLNKLVGTFIEKTEDEYTLTLAALRVLSTVFSGWLGDYESFEGEPIDAECQQCGAKSVVIDYKGGWFTKRCTECPGQYSYPDLPSGLLAHLHRPPAGLINRTPQEFNRATNVWDRNRQRSVYQGVCPDCAGHISAEIDVCPDHDSGDGTVCDQCGSAFEVQPHFRCEVCKFETSGPWGSPPLSDSAVRGFFFDHGLDPDELYVENSQHILHEAVKDVNLLAEDPMRIQVTYELDGDQLEVTLDEDTRVIDVSDG